MDITQEWIASVAGWRATKEGRDLFKQGAVTDSKRKGNIISGTVSSGGKPNKVTVKIHSAYDIDTMCPSMICRRTGEVCGHAVALMLHSISDVATQTSVPEKLTSNSDLVKQTGVMLKIDLPPNFPESISSGQGGMSLKLSVAEGADLSEVDLALTNWMLSATGNSSPQIVAVKGEQAYKFLHCISGHSRVYSAGNKISIRLNSGRIPMSMKREDDRIHVSFAPSISNHVRAWLAGNHLYLWHKEQSSLMMYDVSAIWKLRYWQRMIDGNSAAISLTEFLKCLDVQHDLVAWDDDSELSDIPISAANPSFILVIDGSSQSITAQLRAQYSPMDSHIIGLHDDCKIDFPIPDPEKQGHYLVRNREAEDLAAGILMQSGFHIIDPRGSWQMATEDTILEFLTGTLPRLETEANWSIKSTSKLSSFRNNIVRIIPTFELKGNHVPHSGQDWLAFDVNFHTDAGAEIPKEIIQRMLSSGRRSGTSKNGKRLIISNFDADTVETVLRDTNPKQENGLYFAPKAQAAYLKRLQQFYSNSSLTNQDLRIIKNLPLAIQQSLRPYQETGIAWLFDRATQDGAALLADDMGLGKTLQTLSLIQLLQPDNNSADAKEKGIKALVVCPTSLLGNWQSECKKFFPSLNTMILHGAKRSDYFSVAHSADIVITSYALITRDIAFYTSMKCGTLVIDEASIIRNPDTQAAKSLRKIEAKHRIALTGTPVENAVRDLWSLFHFLLPGYLGSRSDFQQHYQQPLSQRSPDLATMKRLRMRVEPFMLRRTKTNVAKDLPPKILQTIYCDPSASQQKTYANILRHGVQQIESMSDEQAGAARMQVLTVLLRLRQAATDLRLLDSEIDLTLEEASSKMVRLLELLHEAKEGDHRVLIFSQFTSMLALIKSALIASNISYAYLDGATKDRDKEVQKFQSPTGPDVFLISLKAGGYGLNLTAADTVIHFDPWWNPAVEAQATDRAYRIGQTRPTTVYKLVTRGTVEEKILRLQEAKRGMINSTLGEQDGEESAPLMQGLSREEINSLLS